ncbi:bacterial extracellular solute-binding s, 3 family protein, partial [Vibrio parahaemolyticus VPTS-2010_2]
KKVTT